MGRTINAIAERTTELGRVLGVVGEAVGLVIEHLDRASGAPQERRGGYFCLLPDTLGAPPSALVQIGLVRAEKAEKYYDFSCEKAARLASQPGDLSSWQTRDEAHDMYGGAIRAKGAILSFSGLPEPGDEAAMLLVALKLGTLSWTETDAIATVSNNMVFHAVVLRLRDAGTWHDGRWTVPQE